MLLTGILFLVIAVPFPNSSDNEAGTTHFSKTGSEQTEGDSSAAGNGSSNTEAYAEYLEGKLAAVLSEVQGVEIGRAHV